MKRIKVWAFLTLCTCFAYPQSRKVQFEHLSVKDGLSQLSVISIYQDTQGFLWFGTRDGLNKYDGYDFQIFRETDPDHYISNNYIECMAEDANGNLWVGTRRGLNRFDSSTGRFVQYYSSDDSTTISYNNAICLLKDHQGTLWVGTLRGLDRYIPETDKFERCAFDGLPSQFTVYALAEDYSGNLWIGAENGLYVYHLRTNRIRQYRHDPNNVRSIAENRIASLFCDSKSRVWISFLQSGVCLYDEENDEFIRFNIANGLNDNNVRCITEDKAGNILAGTFNGLCSFDEKDQKFVSAYGYTEYDAVPISNFSVYDVLCDRSGTVWVGTYSGGVSYYSSYNQRFRFHDPGMQGRTLFGIVGPMVEHATGIWIGTEGGGLLHFDRNKGSYQYYKLPGSSERSFSRNIIKSLFLEGNYVWIGTIYNTIYCFDVARCEFLRPVSPPWGSIIYMLFRDGGKNFWIGASGGNSLGYLKPNGLPEHPLPLERGQSFNPSNIRCMIEDSVGIYYIASYSSGLYRYNVHKKTMMQFGHVEGDSSSLAHDRITSMCQTKDGAIWIGTFGGGVSQFNRITGTFKNYGRRHGLASEMIYALVADHDNKLWMSTSAGISQFDPQTETFTNFNKNNGIRISEFTPGSGMVTADNEIFFGGNDGFVSFYPQQFEINAFVPPVVITKIAVNNQPLDNVNMIAKKTLRLNHNQSNITIEFSALNYIFPHQNQYVYKLEGFDKQWNEIGNRRTAYYTNIPPGLYTFLVKGSNNDGVWNEQGARLLISISRPPWNSWWAWTLYVMAIATGIYILVYSARIRTQLRNNIHIKHIEQENMEELHQMKIKLFTNFSHELRTPLTLILTPLDDILQNNSLTPALHDALRLMQKNANRLLYTVNQLMDFRKKESGHLQLKTAEGNIVKFVHEIFIAFNELARSRNINFHFDCDMENIQLWYDRNLLEKVLFNLLSNAFKNTPNGGNITVSMAPAKIDELKHDFNQNISQLPELKDFVLISVSDTGTGIPEEEMEKIFDPFYQVHKQGVPQPFGTGIGLNLSKGVVELHQGAIWAANTPAGGALFRIVLPAGKAHLRESDLEPDFRNSEDSSHYMITDSIETTPEQNAETQTEKTHYSILIVEDNTDVRHYVKSHLAKYYAIYEANNGQEAFDMAVELMPDLIVSDIMMPVMDGIELCYRLKEDLRTGHIPVILLTARVTVMQVQEGFDIGADDYITKPFNASLLVARIRNLLISREKLRKLFGLKNSFAFPELPASTLDGRFMDMVYKYIVDNVTDPDLNMDNFCKEIGLSRSNFYRKLRTISNLNPNELIRDIRLQLAVKHLRESDMTIAEIAYNVGFSSPSYFTKSFRLQFKKSPSEMRDDENTPITATPPHPPPS